MIRVGIVGAGGMGERHARNVTGHTDARVSAVLDPVAGRADRLASEFGVRPARTLDELLSTADALILTTPPRRRVDAVRQAAAAGVPIFSEKPLAADLDDGEAIVKIVEAAGVPFMMGFCLRFAKPLIRLREIVRDGRLGDVVYVSRTRMGWLRHPSGNWRIDPDELCGMAVESVSHEFDLLRWLGGEVDHAHGEVVGTAAAYPAYDDNVAATLRFRSGAIGSVQASWQSRVEHNTVSVIGTAGSALVSGPGMWTWSRLDLVVGDDEEQVVFPADDAADMGWAGEIDAFCESVRSGSAPPVGVRDGLAALRLSHQVLASSRAGWPELEGAIE